MMQAAQEQQVAITRLRLAQTGTITKNVGDSVRATVGFGYSGPNDTLTVQVRFGIVNAQTAQAVANGGTYSVDVIASVPNTPGAALDVTVTIVTGAGTPLASRTFNGAIVVNAALNVPIVTGPAGINTYWMYQPGIPAYPEGTYYDAESGYQISNPASSEWASVLANPRLTSALFFQDAYSNAHFRVRPVGLVPDRYGMSVLPSYNGPYKA